MDGQGTFLGGGGTKGSIMVGEGPCTMMTTSSTLAASSALEVLSPVGVGKTRTSSTIVLAFSTVVLSSMDLTLWVGSGMLPGESSCSLRATHSP